MLPSQRPFGFRLGLLCAWILGLGVFKWQVIGPYRLDDFLLGFAVEGCFWGWLFALSWTLSELPRPWARWAGAAVFYPAFYFSSGLIFSYTYFFDSAVERRFSLLDTDLGAMLFFFRDVLPGRGWAILAALVATMHLGAVVGGRRIASLDRGSFMAVLGPLTLATLLLAHGAERVASPLYDIGHDYLELWLTPKIRIEDDTRAYLPVAMLDKSDRGPAALPTRYKKVLVFVMETMTAERLDDEARALRADTFFVKHRGDAHQFDRYFPNNQDSRTGMLDLLGSRLIPYEAYRDADSEAYMGVKHLPSLLDRFKAFGYQTAFAVSQTGLEVIVTDMPWDTLIHLSQADIDAAKSSKLCFQPYEFENSCEDDVVLPKVLDYLDQHERVFLFQEFIWGHAYEYNEASGRSNADYYSSYIDQVIAHLRKRGMLEETLIAVTSDHGFRDKGLQDQLGVYRVPLWFYAPGFDESHQTALLSHLDFKDLLFNELAPGSTPVDHNDAIMIQGPTATALVAALTDTNDFMLVKRRGSQRLLLSHKNVGASLDRQQPPRDPAAPHQLIKAFDDFKLAFDARIAREATQRR